jgi:hypothetical protein
MTGRPIQSLALMLSLMMAACARSDAASVRRPATPDQDPAHAVNPSDPAAAPPNVAPAPDDSMPPGPVNPE